MYNPPLINDKISYVEPLVLDVGMDKDFTMNELRLVLNYSKNNKAPGNDRIPYEFYKSAPDQMLQLLLKVYNKMYETGKTPLRALSTQSFFPYIKKMILTVQAIIEGSHLVTLLAKFTLDSC